MRLRISVAAVVAACGLAAGGIAGAGPAQAVTPAAPVSLRHQEKYADQLCLWQLIDLVTAQVHETYPDATLMLADGSSPSGPTTDMSKVTDWVLIYNTNTPGSSVQALEIHATLEGEIDEPVPHTVPWGGTLPITERVSLSPAKAYAVLKEAGHGDAYEFVSLLRPLVPQSHLQYHFSHTRGGCDGYAVNVDDLAVSPICA
ncbi:hypothetical protein [Streptomyces laurentii]|uniref:hypothetical protein n=1 Tax=Streptomyces laurentii TaxID=39478 RepID=UPI00367AF9B6